MICPKFKRTVLGLHPAYAWDKLHQQNSKLSSGIFDNSQKMSNISISCPIISKIYGWVGARTVSSRLGLYNSDPLAVAPRHMRGQTVVRPWNV